MFPNGKADFATVSQFPELVEKIVKDNKLKGIAFNEFAGGEVGKTYQILSGDIPVKTKSQLISEWNKAQVNQEKEIEVSNLTDNEKKIQETISKKDFENIVERFYPQVRDFYSEDGIKNFQDYLEKTDADVMDLELDSDYTSNRAIHKLLGDEEIYINEVVDMYKNGLLRDEISRESFKVNVDKISDYPVSKKRLFYEPQQVTVNKKTNYQLAIQKITTDNKKSVMLARKKLYLDWASNKNLSKELGISDSELNKKN